MSGENTVKEWIKSGFETCSFRKARRNRINQINRERLKNTDFSLLSSNCNGGVMCHDLGVQFRSQFVNLWMYCNDFVRYLSDLDYYNSIDEITFLSREESGHDYPVGLIDGMKVFFVHYHSDEEAQQKWNERKKRINKDNLFVMMSEQNGCTIEDLEAFDQLPYKHKVVFTKKPYESIKSSFYVPGFEEQKELITILAFKSQFSAERYYDIFPYVDWLNGDYCVGENTEEKS